MKPLDRFLRRWRMAKAGRWVRPGDRVLDVGAFDLTFLRSLGSRISRGVGIDPLATDAAEGHLTTRRASFPPAPDQAPFPPASFDCVTLLAVLEHIPDAAALARACERVLAPGGRVVITVPMPQVDSILALLVRLRLVDGMSLDEHHGYHPGRTVPTFEAAGFRLEHASGFQLGLNRLFVFQKPAAAQALPGAHNTSHAHA